jgi:ketosteroid isomerase-like protein
MIEQQSIDTIKQLYAAFGRRDLTAVFDGLAEDVEWYLPGPPAIVPFAGLRRGKQQVAEFFKVLSETLEFEQFEVDEFVAQADKVVVLGRSRDRMKSTGRVIENRWAALWEIRDGKVTKYHVYEDTAAFVEALK